MGEWWARRQFDQPVTMVLLTGLITWGVTVGAWAIAATDFAVYHVALAALYGLAIPYSAGVRPKQIEAAFPPGTGLDEKMYIWRIVRNGGPIDDPDTAPAVAHHARWRLDRRSPPTLMVTVGFVAPILVINATFNGDASDDTKMYLIAGAVLLAAAPFIARSVQHRRNAEHVLGLVTASRAETPAPPAGNGSAHQGSPEAD